MTSNIPPARDKRGCTRAENLWYLTRAEEYIYMLSNNWLHQFIGAPFNKPLRSLSRYKLGGLFSLLNKLSFTELLQL